MYDIVILYLRAGGRGHGRTASRRASDKRSETSADISIISKRNIYIYIYIR